MSTNNLVSAWGCLVCSQVCFASDRPTSAAFWLILAIAIQILGHIKP